MAIHYGFWATGIVGSSTNMNYTIPSWADASTDLPAAGTTNPGMVSFVLSNNFVMQSTGTTWRISGVGADGTPSSGAVPYYNGTKFAYMTSAGMPSPVLKTADETVNNSTVLQNDDELLLAVGANEIWLIDMYVFALSPTLTSLNTGFSIPAAATLYRHNFYDTNDSALGFKALNEGTASDSGLALASTSKLMRLRYIYIGGANAGNVQFQWAQGAATIEDTKVLANSFMLGHKLN